MSVRAPIQAGVVAFLLGALAPAQQQRADRAREQVAAILERVGSPSDVTRESESLASLGSALLAPLFERLGEARAGKTPLSTAQSAAALAGLSRLPREEVIAFLARLARNARDDVERETGLDLLGRFGGRGELKLALELAAPADPSQPPAPSLRLALESALLGLCERERGAARTLAGFFPRALPAFQAVIARVMARAGGDDASVLLAQLLGGGSAEVDALVLVELAGVASHDRCEDLVVLERVRGLLGHPEPRLAVLACLALEKLRDHGAVPDLIVLLSGRDANLRARAHAALASLTGLSLPSDAQPWIAWLDESLAWWDERADECRAALVSGTPAEAVAVLHETAQQRLFLDQVVEVLALALRRPEPDLVKSACRALGAIPEQSAREALAPLVAHADPTIADRARAALERHERMRPRAFRPSPLRHPARGRIQ